MGQGNIGAPAPPPLDPVDAAPRPPRRRRRTAAIATTTRMITKSRIGKPPIEGPRKERPALEDAGAATEIVVVAE